MRTNRAVIPAKNILPDVWALRSQRLLDMFHRNPVTIPAIVKKNWPKNFESILLFLGQNLGVKKIPLSYVVST